MSFHPPTDGNGKALSHEEWCERIGIPYSQAQKYTRQALWDFIAVHGQLGTESDSWSDEMHAEYNTLSDAITIADAQRRIEARAAGWLGYPGMLEHQAKQRAKAAR
jgi:hypothetical protein